MRGRDRARTRRRRRSAPSRRSAPTPVRRGSGADTRGRRRPRTGRRSRRPNAHARRVGGRGGGVEAVDVIAGAVREEGEAIRRVPVLGSRAGGAPGSRVSVGARVRVPAVPAVSPIPVDDRVGDDDRAERGPLGGTAGDPRRDDVRRREVDARVRQQGGRGRRGVALPDAGRRDGDAVVAKVQRGVRPRNGDGVGNPGSLEPRAAFVQRRFGDRRQDERGRPDGSVGIGGARRSRSLMGRGSVPTGKYPDVPEEFRPPRSSVRP